MAWPLPQPIEIADRLASGYETGFQDITPLDQPVDARSPRAPLAVIGRVQAEGTFDLYLRQERIAEELFPDTAQDELARHADIWNVPRREATYAGGSVTFEGTNGLPVPSALEFRLGGISVVTTAGGEIAGGFLTVPAVATTAGAAGNFPVSTILPLVTPIGGLSTQAAVVAAPGFAGGVEQEEIEDWRARILARIRQGVAYGQRGAYEAWAKAALGVSYVKEVPGWAGLGTVGVIFLTGTKAAPTAPSGGEVAALQASLDDVRPVTAAVFAVPGMLAVTPLTLFLKPDTVATRAAVTSAYALFLQAEPGIGGTIEHSRLDEAISSAPGEYAHRLDVPAASVVLGATELAVPGAITWAVS